MLREVLRYNINGTLEAPPCVEMNFRIIFDNLGYDHFRYKACIYK